VDLRDLDPDPLLNSEQRIAVPLQIDMVPSVSILISEGHADLFSEQFPTRNADSRRMKCGSVEARVGTEVGLSLVRRAR
jgi:hypothetical protein